MDKPLSDGIPRAAIYRSSGVMDINLIKIRISGKPAPAGAGSCLVRAGSPSRRPPSCLHLASDRQLKLVSRRFFRSLQSSRIIFKRAIIRDVYYCHYHYYRRQATSPYQQSCRVFASSQNQSCAHFSEGLKTGPLVAVVHLDEDENGYENDVATSR